MGDRFEISETPLVGLSVLQRRPIGDSRGYLERLYCVDELRPFMGERQIVQINHTLTAKQGTVRGMHYQIPPYAETKFVSCIHGEVFDVAVDLRPDSPTFLAWHAVILSPGRHNTMLIPEGFAHGFQTLTDDSELLYFHTASYRAEAERGLSPQDPRLAIDWPITITVMSERDAEHPPISANFSGVTL
jgi:dTDP-4-dehydrorhamnose 3,5-epimerase